MNKTQLRLNNNGFTFIEVLVAAGMLIIAATAAGLFLVQQTTYINQLSAREQILSTIEIYAGMAGAIRNSAKQPVNLALTKCLTVTTPGELDCQNGVSYDLVLFGPFQGGATGGDGAVSGPPSNPMKYTSLGGPCTGATANCNLQISTTFRAICPFNPPSLQPANFCDAATVIEVTYNVTQFFPYTRVYTNSVGTSVSSIFGH